MGIDLAFKFFIFLFKWFWKIVGFIFLWRPLAWFHKKLWITSDNTYFWKQIITIRGFFLSLILLWYVSFYAVVFLYLSHGLPFLTFKEGGLGVKWRPLPILLKNRIGILMNPTGGTNNRRVGYDQSLKWSEEWGESHPRPSKFGSREYFALEGKTDKEFYKWGEGHSDERIREFVLWLKGWVNENKAPTDLMERLQWLRRRDSAVEEWISDGPDRSYFLPHITFWYQGSAGPFGLLCFLYYRFWFYRPRKSQGSRNESAPNFNDRKHQMYLKNALENGVNYIGYSGDGPVYFGLEDRNQHIDCVGTTGSGKTAYVLLTLFRQDIQLGLPAIFVDAKGSRENAEEVYRIVRSSGREKDFKFFSLTLLENSDSYNPLLRGNMVQVCDKIISAMDWSKEQPYFEGLCQTALLKLLSDFESSKVPFTFKNILKAMEEVPGSLREFSNFMKGKKNWEYTQTLRNEFNLIVKSPFGFLFDTTNPAIDLMKVYKENLIVYFSLDMQSYPKQAQRIGRLITSDINTLSGLVEATLKRNEKRSLCIYIDEFQAFGTKNFLNSLARGRSSGLCITLAHQSIGDLRAVGDEFVQQVTDLTNTKIFLKVNDPESAQLFSDSLGTYEAVDVTRQVQISGITDFTDKIMGSERDVEKYRIHPSEIKDLRTGEAVIKGLKGYAKVSLCPYFLDLDREGVVLPINRRGIEEVS